MILYIDQLQESIITDFKDTWLENFPPDEDFQATLLLISYFLESRMDFYYELLNLSLIEGEYIIIDERINITIDNIISLINIICESEINEFTADQNGELYSLLNNNLFFLKYSLERYKALVTSVNRRYNQSPNISTLFDYLSNNAELPDKIKNANKSIVTRSDVFQKSLKLTGLDHVMTADQKVLEQIALTRFELKNIDLNKPYLTYIREKCEFLFYKINFRFYQRNENFLGVINTIDEDLKPDETKMVFFKQWVDHIKEHYNENEMSHSEGIKAGYEKNVYKIGINEQLNYFEFHINTKYFKDIVKDLTRLETNVEDFKQSFQYVALSNFDKQAYKISENYFNNNIFSRKVEDNLQNYHLFKKEIKSFLNNGETYLYNFFPLKKSIVLLDNHLDRVFENDEYKNEKSKELDDVKDTLLIYRSALNKIKENIDFCIQKKSVIFQLPFKECRIEKMVDGTLIKGFINSSFVLPIAYKKELSELKNHENNYQNYVTQYKVRLSIQSDLIEIKKLRSAVDNTDKRSVEILSIFAAIVLFVAGDIQIFTKINDSQIAVRFMLLFGYVLGSFVLLIWFITRADGFRFKNLSKVHIFILFVFAGVTGFLICLMLGVFEPGVDEIQKDKNDIKNKIEILEGQLKEKKLQKEIRRLDSLK